MSRPTLTQVYDAARSAIADDRITGGQIYTNTVLLPHVQAAVRDLFRTMRKISNPYIQREVYHVLPADTSVLHPSTASITDLADPLAIEERGGLTIKAVTGASNQTSPDRLRVTAVGHGLSTGDRITLNGLGGLRNAAGIFAITVVDADTFDANGVISTGTYTSGGSAVKSTEEFAPMWWSDRIAGVGHSPTHLSQWAWREGMFHFQPSTEQRQLRIIYGSSATVPTTGADVIAVDDCQDFLAYRAAALAANVIAPVLSDRLNRLALGPNMEADGTGGMLFDLLNQAVKAVQRKPPAERTRAPFREPRVNEVFDY